MALPSAHLLGPLFTEIQVLRNALSSAVPNFFLAQDRAATIAASTSRLSLCPEESRHLLETSQHVTLTPGGVEELFQAADRMEKGLRPLIGAEVNFDPRPAPERLAALLEGRLAEYDFSRRAFYGAGDQRQSPIRSSPLSRVSPAEVMQRSLEVMRRVQEWQRDRSVYDRLMAETEPQVVEAQIWAKDRDGYTGRVGENFLSVYRSLKVRVLRGECSDRSVDSIRDLHRQLTEGLAIDHGWHRWLQGPGQYRLAIINPLMMYYSPHPWQIRSLMNDYVSWVSGPQMASLHPMERAARAYQRLLEIHPFRDGNRRTGQMMLFEMLAKAGVPLPAPSPKQSSEMAILGTPFVEIIGDVVAGVERHLDFLDYHREHPEVKFQDYQEELWSARHRKPRRG